MSACRHELGLPQLMRCSSESAGNEGIGPGGPREIFQGILFRGKSKTRTSRTSRLTMEMQESRAPNGLPIMGTLVKRITDEISSWPVARGSQGKRNGAALP